MRWAIKRHGRRDARRQRTHERQVHKYGPAHDNATHDGDARREVDVCLRGQNSDGRPRVGLVLVFHLRWRERGGAESVRANRRQGLGSAGLRGVLTESTSAASLTRMERRSPGRL